MPKGPAPGLPASRMPRAYWLTTALVGLTAVYAGLHATLVAPYLWPAGHGLRTDGDSRLVGGGGDGAFRLARPPQLGERGVPVALEVVPGSPAARGGIAAGDLIVRLEHPASGATANLGDLRTLGGAERIERWRAASWTGLQGPVRLSLQSADAPAAAPRRTELARPAFWHLPGSIRRAWAERHLGPLGLVLAFTAGALALVLFRSASPTAALAASALALAAAGNAGPLLGAERMLPGGLGGAMTLFGWVAAPLAFPAIGLTILYFPSRAARLDRQRWLLGLPWLAAAPMIASGLVTGGYLAGADALRAVVAWDAANPWPYFASFGLALGVNVLLIVEGLGRYRTNPNANERRRIRLVVLTGVPAVLAFALKEGLTAAAGAWAGSPAMLPWWVSAPLYLVIAAPAIGLPYAVGVHRVLGPRLALRRSLQYALARRTLTGVALLPAVALVASLVRQRELSLAAIVSGAPGFYLALVLLSFGALRYRDRARAWLDRRFFREAYDARTILVALAERVRFETDPGSLTTLVARQIEAAFHPETVAILVTGLEDGQLTPVSVVRGSAESLPLGGGITTMLQWSDDPLELYPSEAGSPARRLPEAEQAWLECTGAVLLLPVFGPARGASSDRSGSTPPADAGAARSLIGLIALGQKRSEEPYTAEDRELLSSIAAQVGLFLDVVRLRRQFPTAADQDLTTIAGTAAAEDGSAMRECPLCGLCADGDALRCSADGAPLVASNHVPRVLDRKYRIDQALGRGGMGAVYRAHDLRLDRDVAIKLVRPDLLALPEARERFRREAQLVARLQHPAVVSVFDYGSLRQGGAYLVMELVRGESLRDRLRRETRLTPADAARTLLAICEGVEAAHAEGILHRDLKPENILLPSGGSRVKILDFGVARLFDTRVETTAVTAQGASLTLPGALVGTPAYMAPEQLQGRPLDARTDIYTLGVIGVELITGRLPRSGEGPVQWGGPAQPQSLSAELPTQLDDPIATVLAAAVQAEPERRPPTVRDFATRLEAAMRAIG